MKIARGFRSGGDRSSAAEGYLSDLQLPYLSEQVIWMFRSNS